MAAAARPMPIGQCLAPDVKGELRRQWLGRRRIPEDFDRLWDLYWAELGPLAAVPDDIHQLEEVLVR